MSGLIADPPAMVNASLSKIEGRAFPTDIWYTRDFSNFFFFLPTSPSSAFIESDTRTVFVAEHIVFTLRSLSEASTPLSTSKKHDEASLSTGLARLQNFSVTTCNCQFLSFALFFVVQRSVIVVKLGVKPFFSSVTSLFPSATVNM